ncbi:Oidioi.mRNA.OKI2018_I69.chr2.g7444.t1.cds [Oikopleura dioica]|uniref:Oidioi.mRNA.OKI2018_I69.chr2.g7444.t1.cds n=1 Tax=Oikopleura dioica TaxID=34765 RepID=A0ABN7T679_OIKDI|nr:Oidioi.mRNA.OKI2018_I69.chr2.g7444.t1.cds [Oikopleura dioica]
MPATEKINFEPKKTSESRKRKSDDIFNLPANKIKPAEESSPLGLDTRLKELLKESSSNSPLDGRPKTADPPAASTQERMIYKALFQLHTIIGHHDDDGRPNPILRNAEAKDWETDKKLKRYSRQVQEAKKLLPFIRGHLKKLERKQSPK